MFEQVTAPQPSPPCGPVKHVVSLGCRCSQAVIFKEIGQRRYACPFDWIFSSARIVLHCLKDDFGSFLDRSLMYLNATVVDAVGLKPGSAPRERKLIGHRIYSDMTEGVGRGTIFNHRDPLNSESDYDYVCRTVERFRLVMSHGERKMFVVMNLNKQLWIERDLRELFDELSRRTRNFTLLAVNCCMNLGEEALRMEVELQSCETRAEGQLLLYSLPCVGANSGSYFRHDFDAGRAREILVAPFRFELPAGDPLDAVPSRTLAQAYETTAADSTAANAVDIKHKSEAVHKDGQTSSHAPVEPADVSVEGPPVIRRWARRTQQT